MEKLIPARYIGTHEVLLDIGQLKAAGRPLVNGYGEPLKPLVENAVTHAPAYGLRPGDTFMMPEGDILGKTYLHPNGQNRPSILVGTGKVVLEEHKDIPMSQLQSGLVEYDGTLWSYEFSQGRSDFEVLNLENSDTPVSPSETQETALQFEGTNVPATSAETAVESPDTNNEVVETQE
jgi:hypothetical protein